MDLSLEKQLIKQELDLINDESIILTIKNLLGLNKVQKPGALTHSDLISRDHESEAAISNNEVVSLPELEAEMNNW